MSHGQVDDRTMIEWIQQYEALFWGLAAGSAVIFIATLIIVPILVVRLPSRYFSRRRRPKPLWASRHPTIRLMLLLGKSMVGIVLVLAGILMLVLPGQGIITILVGLTFLEFPGKYRLQRWIVERGPVLRSINWLRRRAGRPPLILEG